MCNVIAHDCLVEIPAATGKLDQEPFAPSTAIWKDWELPSDTADPLLNIVRLPLLLSWLLNINISVPHQGGKDPKRGR